MTLGNSFWSSKSRRLISHCSLLRSTVELHASSSCMIFKTSRATAAGGSWDSLCEVGLRESSGSETYTARSIKAAEILASPPPQRLSKQDDLCEEFPPLAKKILSARDRTGSHLRSTVLVRLQDAPAKRIRPPKSPPSPRWALPKIARTSGTSFSALQLHTPYLLQHRLPRLRAFLPLSSIPSACASPMSRAV